ncbi:2OG-Fe(II) oxygenase [Marinomonas sp. 15G1-11]|uniref:2OG-Fe(II) oxygenase n=1 Tax=Marinomonas phaeophyticola TaxID=3004091 RepID=A0ABT4JVH1_9GAMM|nr:2OG-Fe(II) oxygenase [Marinomonas sp. 15G1-11]MCZ2722344.1 2OG-Fe(II) oxygenase [Marinomonas sp. 15G1-11]
MKHTETEKPPLMLQRARDLTLPSREAMLQRSPSVKQFWDGNKLLLQEAWKEWEESNNDPFFIPDDSLLDERLRNAVEQAWEDPSKELTVQDLWQEVSPGVFQCPFFDPERLADLRHYLDNVANAEIPLRPPYGIVLNRHGAMLDPRSEGYLAAPNFQTFYRVLLNKYMRPIARLLFPEIVGYDTQTFGFSIQYQAEMDTSLRLHTDASAATLNVNINLPDEAFTGSEVDFYDPHKGEVNRLTFKPGMAMLHRGNVAHAAQPITSGKRSNFVLWLYGDRMQIPSSQNQLKRVSPNVRWSLPPENYDDVAPF